MLGSFVGSVLGSFVYKTAYSCAISYCIDTGCTFFGLVEQNYTLPENVLKEMGVKVFEYEKFIPKHFEPLVFEPKRFNAPQFEPLKLQITVLRRGVIGISAIGYI